MFVNVLFAAVIFYFGEHQKLQRRLIGSPDFSRTVMSLIITI